MRIYSYRIELRSTALCFSLIMCVLFRTVSLFAATNSPADTSLTFYTNDIKFEGSTVRIDSNYRYILESFVEYLQKNPTIYVHIRGHVCCRAGERISKRRARHVYRFLYRHGISKDRLTHAGYSNTIPLAFPERTKEDERVNRRVDFVLTERK